MKKTIIKICYLVVVFIASVLILSNTTNNESADMTAKMSSPTLPTITLYEGSSQVNVLNGYTDEMEVNYMRGAILPIDDSRSVSFSMNLFDANVTGLSFEVRTLDGTSLVESTDIENYDVNTDKNLITASFNIKDLIDNDEEYMLVILANVDGETVRYYSRVICSGDSDKYNIEEKMSFVKNFHEKTFDKEAAKDELTVYLESNSEGDNSSFGKVNIHSSFSQITWGDLNIVSHTDPSVFITDIHGQTGLFRLESQVTLLDDDNKQKTYNVVEIFRVRYTSDRMYLLDYERTMNYVFDEAPEDISGGVLNLSITNQDSFQMKESEGGNIIAFVSQDRLFVYSISDNKMSYVYGFYDKDNNDERCTLQNNNIQILSVDEAGNMRFIVSGYMNRGRHEGKVGTSVMEFNSSLNSTEELIFIPSTKSEEIVNCYVSMLSYSNNNNDFYMIQGNSVYLIDLGQRTCKAVINDIMNSDYVVSSSGSLVAWQNTDGSSDDTKFEVMNLNSQTTTEISGSGDDIAVPLGFINEDIIYGLIHPSDIHDDQAGNPVYAIYSVIIQDTDGNVLENYSADGYFITGVSINDNQIQLSRVKWDAEDETYVTSTNDQIMSTIEGSSTDNKIGSATSDVMKKLLQITLTSSASGSSCKYLTPEETLYEGSREVSIKDTADSSESIYYVYTQNGVSGIYASVSDAVNAAYDAAGSVVDTTNRYIWYRSNRQTKNQIMSITNAVEGQTASGTSSLQTCLEVMLQFEGISQNVNEMLADGMTPCEILSSSLPDAKALDLGGCSLDSVLYYVNQDIPVMAIMNDGSAVLVIGFNDLNTVIYDPKLGTESVYKLGINDSEKLFTSNGNHFITFINNN